MNPYFFGYGSLVNRDTHNYPDTRHARLRGWRRIWVCTAQRDIVFLTVRPDPHCAIDGLIAAVPDADWAALDKREAGYDRLHSGTAILHDLTPPPQIAHYTIPQSRAQQMDNHTILLSYLDVVVQGYYREFGAEGVSAFFDTTDGWHTPIINDRAAPIYPRHQLLTPSERTLVDDNLARLSARVE